MSTRMSTRRPKHTTSHVRIATAGKAGPSLGFWSDIEAQIATPVLSSRVPLPDSWRVLKDAQRLRLPSAPGAYRFVPDPISEIRIGKAEREKREKDRRPNAFFRARQGCHSKSYAQFLSSV